ncbi:glycosyl hydrolase family 28-related protein [Falsiroseomonas tokyonensis]|uniref:Glycosyl hydrolase family 28-related protein n=1 Tax=Falsiroseomonas tokyonensis TaxID=430521 RepID=A0ABV7BW88_9PROT|nr:glycosyl hydrolase family 28-related protein [Falsiroseomonas tokyonensis]MBU8538754.1 hypothetical protein [Falsiroseomonas tokyonensis]
MADAKISDLPAATALAAADIAPIVQGSGAAAVTRRATFAQITAGVHAERMFHVRDFGAVGNGTTDDAAAIQAAIDAAAAAGGGLVRLGPRRYRVTGSDIVLKENVCLEGPGAFPGGQRVSADYRNIPGTLLLSSARTIQVLRASTLRALTLIRDGLGAPPASLRAAVNLRNDMAGTAITVGGASGGHHDALIEDLLILGFDLAIRSDNNQRLNVRRLRGDNRNGIYLSNTRDISRIHDVHFWPFLTGNIGGISLYQRALAAVANNGSGAVRITTTTAHGLVTGDLVNTFGIGGVPPANGRFTVTVIDSTRIDLQGSSFSGSWAGSGSLSVWNNRRLGTAFRVEVSDVAEFINCFCYGYERGFDLGDGAQSIQLHNCSVDDSFSLKDPNTVGALIQGSAFRTKWVGGFISSQATAIRVNSTSSTQGDNQFVGVMVGGDGGGRAVEVFDGGLTLVACDLPAARVYLGSSGDSLSVVASDTRSTTFEAQTGADLARIALVGNRLQALGSSPDQASALLRRRSEALGAELDLENQDGAISYRLSLGAGALAPLTIGGDAAANPNGGIVLGADSAMTAPMKMTLRRSSTTPAAGHALGQLAFSGRNLAGTETEFARAGGISEAVTTGAEAGAFVVETRNGGSLAERFRISATGTVTLTGPLVLPADPTATNQAANKGYVDAQFTDRRLPVVATSGATALTLAAHNGRLVSANAGTTLSIAWASTGDGFSCLVANRGASDLALSMSGFTAATPTNPDGLTKIRAGGLATLLAFSPDGGTTKVLMLAGAGAP